MKVNLLLDSPGDVRSGYVNIDQFAKPNDSAGRIQGDVSNLDQYVDTGEATEIIALDILHHFGPNDADTVLSNWLSKLAHGGKLTFSVVDYKEVARGILANTLSADDVNELLHGTQDPAWKGHRSSFTLSDLVQVLQNRGFRVLSKRVQSYRAILTVQRP